MPKLTRRSFQVIAPTFQNPLKSTRGEQLVRISPMVKSTKSQLEGPVWLSCIWYICAITMSRSTVYIEYGPNFSLSGLGPAGRIKRSIKARGDWTGHEGAGTGGCLGPAASGLDEWNTWTGRPYVIDPPCGGNLHFHWACFSLQLPKRISSPLWFTLKRSVNIGSSIALQCQQRLPWHQYRVVCPLVVFHGLFRSPSCLWNPLAENKEHPIYKRQPPGL